MTKLTDIAINNMIKKYQETNDRRIFNVLYRQFRYAWYFVIKQFGEHSATWYKDAKSVGDRAFLACLNDYDVTKDKRFITYFITRFKWMIIEEFRIEAKHKNVITESKSKRKSGNNDVEFFNDYLDYKASISDNPLARLIHKENLINFSKEMLDLSEREQLIMLGSMGGMNYRQIAKGLGVKISVVQEQIKRIKHTILIKEKQNGKINQTIRNSRY